MHWCKNSIARIICDAKPTTYIHESQINTYVNASGKNTIARMISGAKPTMYIHEFHMNTENNAPVQKHDCNIG
jgi:hypothetical protein